MKFDNVILYIPTAKTRDVGCSVIFLCENVIDRIEYLIFYRKKTVNLIVLRYKIEATNYIKNTEQKLKFVIGNKQMSN